MTAVALKSPGDTSVDSNLLVGKRVLVVEDDYLIATYMCRAIADHGATVIGPAPTPFYALGLLGHRGVDIAVLDIRLHGSTVFEFADELVARQIPIVFATGHADSMPSTYRHHTTLLKPIRSEHLIQTLAQTLRPEPPKHVPAHAPAGNPEKDRLAHAVINAIRFVPR